MKIEQIDLFPIEYPTLGYFKFFEGPSGRLGRPAVVVRLTAENGMVGWGQSVPSFRWSEESLESAMAVLRHYLAPVLRGADALDLEGAQAVLDGALGRSFSTAMPIARAGLDLALHDLYGKLTGKSIAEICHRKPGGPVALSWTVNAKSLADAEAVIDTGWQRGYRNFNIKVAPDTALDVELARLVKRRAPEGFLWADANCGYDVDVALEVAPRLADAGVDVLESPLRPNRLHGYQRLKKLGALPILMDEGIVSPVELDEFIRLDMLDGIAMKPSRTGGLFAARQQIEMIEDRGLMWLGSGLSDPDIALAASLGLYSAFGLTKPAALNGPQFLDGDILARRLDIERAVATPPAGPGIGVDIDEQKLARLAVPA